MQGKEVLWLPGTDHAASPRRRWWSVTLKKQVSSAIATISGGQVFGESLGVEGQARWHHHPAAQKLGASCDWSRDASRWTGVFALRANGSFVDLYKKG